MLLQFCFPDIVFLIYLYQRYIYPVDRKRVNEFGISAEMEELAKNGITPQMLDDELLTDGAVGAVEGAAEAEKGGNEDQELPESEPEPKPASEKKKD